MTTTMDDVLTAVKAVDEKTDKLVTWQSKMDERCDNHREKTELLLVTMFGKNGGPGIKEKVNALTNIGIFLKAVLSIAAGGCLVAFVVWMMSIFKGH